MSFEQQLRAHLAEKAKTIEVPARTLEVRPLPARRGRAWNALSAAAIVAVAVGGLGYLVNAAGNSDDGSAVLPTFPEEAAITPSARGIDPLVGDLEFSWNKTLGVDVGAVVPIGDGFLVFYRDRLLAEEDDAEPVAHIRRTLTGEEWVELGSPVDGLPVQVESWGDGVAGVFVNGTTGNLSLWETVDGATWTKGTVPPTARTATQLRILGEMDGGLLVYAGYDGSDPLTRAIRLTLEETYPPSSFFVEVSATTVRVVHRTLFVEVHSFDRAERGLAPRLESSEPTDLGYWWTDDLVSWTRVPSGQIIEGFDPTELFDVGDESFLAGRTGSKLYVTEDRRRWDPRPLASSWQLAEHGGEFVVAGYGASESLLLRSDDLRAWAPLPTPEAFEAEPVLDAVESGPAGVAALVLDRSDPPVTAAGDAFRFEIADGDTQVAYDLIAGTVELRSGQTTLWTQPIFGIDPSLVLYDPETDSVQYLDPTTQAVATVTAEEVAAISALLPNRAALLFTDNLDAWIVAFLPPSSSYSVAIGTERLAIAMDEGIWIGRPE